MAFSFPGWGCSGKALSYDTCHVSLKPRTSWSDFFCLSTQQKYNVEYTGHWPSKLLTLLLHSMSRLTTRNLILIFWGTLNLAFWHFCTLCAFWHFCTLCKTLKGQVFTKTGERHFSKWHFGDHSSSWTHAPNPKNVKSDNTAEIYIGRASYLSCKLGGLTFLLALLGTGALGMYKTRNVRQSKPDIWKAP